MGNRSSIYFTVSESIIAFLTVNLCYLTATFFDNNIIGFRWKVTWLVVNIAAIPAVYFIVQHTATRSLHIEKIVGKAFIAAGIHALFFFALLSFLNSWIHDRSFYLWFYATMCIMMPLSLISTRLIIKFIRRNGCNSTAVIIIGTGATAQRLRDEMLADPGYGYTFKGFFSKDKDDDGVDRQDYAGTIECLNSFLSTTHIDEIYFALSAEDYETLHRVVVIADAKLIQVYVVPQISRYAGKVNVLGSIGNVPFLSIRTNPLKSVVNRAIKRGGDVIGSTIFLLIAPIAFLAIAAAIKLTSPGPVFFRQKRTGYLGKEFTCYKFRTMYVNTQSESTPTRRDDPRITPVGRILRRTSLDELPQVINVLLGDMSIVGPRPHMISQTNDYIKLIDRYMVRHLIKPGITGWAQINGYRGLTEEIWKMEKRVEHDVWYMENWSPLLDLKIITLTARNLLKRDNNAF